MRERKKKRGRGEGCTGRVRVMICRVSRSDDSDPSSRRVGRETKEGYQESQPGIFFPRPRPRLISFPAFFLFLPSLSSPSLFFFFFYLIREPAITTATRHSCSAIPRLLLLLPFSIFLLLPRWMIFHRVHVFLPIVSSLRLKTPLRRHVRPPERLRSLPTSLMLNHSRKNCNQSSLLGTRVEGRK